ncbi:MAG: hypothetical protein IT306_09635 [Chloroflexi bacterium]|nr:hypothetical protein [Chloroflexota bacterium]
MTFAWTAQRAAVAHVAHRAMPTVGLVAALVVTVLGLPAPTQAQPARSRDPAARVQLIVKSAHILDDHDWHSEGDLQLEAKLLRCSATDTCFPGNDGMAGLTDHLELFDASSDETVPLNVVIPKLGDQGHSGYDLSERAGYPMYAGAEYLLWLDMYDTDDELDPAGVRWEYLGRIYVWLTPGNDWGVGSYTPRSFWTDGGPADYYLDFEIRRTPLPDLRAREIRSFDAGGLQYRCVVVDNVGSEPSGLFQLGIRDSGVPLSRTPTLPALEVGASTEHCVLLSELGDGQRELSFAIDEARQVPEMDEANNRIALVVDRTASPTPGPTPMPTPSAARSDLTISAIEVNGRTPDGKDDCKDGKNDVTAVVKNTGNANAGAFAVSLAVDKVEVGSESAPGLDAGQEREVRFEHVRLKKGQRTLTATVDPAKRVAEADEANNTLTVTAACKDDD